MADEQGFYDPATAPDTAPDSAADAAGDALVLRIEGFEGPIDVLLELARRQKVDLTGVSILALAEQYLAFIQAARRLRLEIAADYLVMAAWLAYLKSRLLLPAAAGPDEEPTGEALAAALSFQLRRLEAMRRAGEALMRRPRLGRDVFARGAPLGLPVVTRVRHGVTLLDLMRAYATTQRRGRPEPLHIRRTELMTVEEAMARLTALLGRTPGWTMLTSLLPAHFTDPLERRSALAATLVAGLEMVRAGAAEISQGQRFGPILLRRRTEEEPG